MSTAAPRKIYQYFVSYQYIVPPEEGTTQGNYGAGNTALGIPLPIINMDVINGIEESILHALNASGIPARQVIVTNWKPFEEPPKLVHPSSVFGILGEN